MTQEIATQGNVPPTYPHHAFDAAQGLSLSATTQNPALQSVLAHDMNELYAQKHVQEPQIASASVDSVAPSFTQRILTERSQKGSGFVLGG